MNSLLMTGMLLDAAGAAGLGILILGGLFLAVLVVIIAPIIGLIIAGVMALKEKREKRKNNDTNSFE